VMRASAAPIVTATSSGGLTVRIYASRIKALETGEIARP
jgi:hypothetical protein